MSNKYDPSKLAHHTPHGSKYSQRHPARETIEPNIAPVKAEKKREPQTNPAQEYRKTFLAAAQGAEWADIPQESRVAFLNVLNEAVMMKATLMELQNPYGQADGFARTISDNLFRRVRDHAAGNKGGIFGQLLEDAPTPYELAPEVKAAVHQFATEYFTAHDEEHKAALSQQYSQGRK